MLWSYVQNLQFQNGSIIPRKLKVMKEFWMSFSELNFIFLVDD